MTETEELARELFNYRRHPQQPPFDELPERFRDIIRTEAEFLAVRGVRKVLPTETVVPREPTEEMVDRTRCLWLWYAGIPHEGPSAWTLGKHNASGGYGLILEPDEAGAVHLPKHIMSAICWRNMIAEHERAASTSGEGK